MKKKLIIVQALCGLIGLLPILASAHGVLGSVMVLVKEQVKNESKSKNSGSQAVVLEITLNGKPQNPENRTLKWSAYGKDQKTGDVVAMESGEAKVNLEFGSTQKISTQKITTTYTEKHTTSSSSGGGRGRTRRVKYTEVPGSGVKYYGYGVQVFDGDEVAGEKFDPAIIEKKLSPAP